jgi:hypothetical protein
MLISTRADASSHSLREPYHLPHGGVVCPMGCEVLYMGALVACNTWVIYSAAVLQSRAVLVLFLQYAALCSSSDGTAFLHLFPLVQAQAIHHGAHRYCVDVRPGRPVAPPGAPGRRWSHGHCKKWQSFRYCLLRMHRRVSLSHETSWFVIHPTDL